MTFAEDRKEPGEADGAADAWEVLVAKITTEVVVAATGSNRADIAVIFEDGFENGAGVVIEAANNHKINCVANVTGEFQ